MSPMILSDKVAGIIKELNIKIGIQDIALGSAAKQIEDYKTLNENMHRIILDLELELENRNRTIRELRNTLHELIIR